MLYSSLVSYFMFKNRTSCCHHVLIESNKFDLTLAKLDFFLSMDVFPEREMRLSKCEMAQNSLD